MVRLMITVSGLGDASKQEVLGAGQRWNHLQCVYMKLKCRCFDKSAGPKLLIWPQAGRTNFSMAGGTAQFYTLPEGCLRAKKASCGRGRGR